MRRFLLVLAVAAAGAAGLTQWLAADAEQRFPARGSFVEVRGARIHYVERGAGSPIVLVHGAYGTLDDFMRTIVAPLATTHRVIAFDRPSHGHSEALAKPLHTPAAQAEFVHEFVTRLGLERPWIAGFSYGGATAAAYALLHPDSIAGVVLINPALYPWPDPTSVLHSLPSVPFVGSLFAHTLALPLGLASRDGGLETAFWPAAVSSSFDRDAIALALRPASFLSNSRELGTLKAALAAQSPRYGETRVPVTLIAGFGDQVASATFHSQRYQREVPHAELVIVPDAGHQVLYSHPSDVATAIQAACRRAAAPR